MSIPGLGTLKTYALAGLAVLAGILYALFRSQQALRAKEKLDGIKKARETEKKATEAMIDGLQNEQEAKDADIDTTKRDHFE